MNSPTPVPHWYADPHNPGRRRYWNGTVWTAPTPPMSVSGVFGRVLAYLLAIAVLTGLVSGNVGMPLFGTIFGLVAVSASASRSR